MSAQTYRPTLRLEIRNKTPEGDAPWFVFDLAGTDSQASDKLRRHKVAEDCETRIMPNDPLGTPPAPVIVDSQETKILLEQVGTENLALRRELNATNAKLEKMNTDKKKAEAPKVDALAGETPLPFGVGDLMRDVHTGVVVKVTEINPPHPRTGNKRAGFAWENTTNKPGDKDHTGFCPLASVGAFAKPGEKLEEKPAPVAKPAAAEPIATFSNDPGAPVTSSAAAPATLIEAPRVNRAPRAARAAKPAAKAPKAARHKPAKPAKKAKKAARHKPAKPAKKAKK